MSEQREVTNEQNTQAKTEMHKALAFSALRKTFVVGLFKRQKHIAVDNLTCSFPKGLCTGLLGHNGAGKTTAIRMALGLISPEKGIVTFNGNPICRNDRKLIGYLPEVNRLPCNLTCEEVLHFHLKYLLDQGPQLRNIKPAVEGLLRQVDLWSHRKKKVGQLSKGMARKLAWVQAVSHKPELLILDEPFSGLDPAGRIEMKKWILDLKANQKTIILCTHEMKTVEDLCDEIHILNSGSLAFSTIDAYKGSDDSKVELPSKDIHLYNLCVSGADENIINKMKTDFHLSSWRSYEQQGFLLSMNFDDYTTAAKWLLLFLNKGFVIVRFGKAHNLTEEVLIKYFIAHKSGDKQ